MKKYLVVAALLGGLLLAASTAIAADAKKPCSEVEKALKSGKTEEQAAKDLRIPLSRVRECAQHPH
jgi:hypothetical protein